MKKTILVILLVLIMFTAACGTPAITPDGDRQKETDIPTEAAPAQKGDEKITFMHFSTWASR